MPNERQFLICMFVYKFIYSDFKFKQILVHFLPSTGGMPPCAPLATPVALRSY